MRLRASAASALTVRRPDGTEYTIDVSEDVYDHCYRGSRYPACVKR